MITRPTPAEIAAARADNIARKQALGPGPEMAAVQTLDVPVTGAEPVRVRLLVPTFEPAGVLIYLHGGAWVMGSIDTFDRLGRALAARSGFALAMVDYAKAPERPYPAAVQDARAALRWAGEYAESALADLGCRLPAGWPLVIGGDSSGGNLATVAARGAPDAGVPLAGQVLIYPVTDSHPDRPEYLADPDSRDRLLQLWELYCPADQRTHPDVAPLRADSLAGLPRTLIVTAEHDLLNAEVDDYAARLEAEGVDVERHRIPGLAHGCLSYWDTEAEADRALDAIARWLGC